MQHKLDENMEDFITSNVCSPSPVADKSPDVRTTESAENFQKFMYDLFEKNGVINDLRAYLRGRIVEILRSTRTGDPPSCQKNFTQRLERPFQAMNMLIAEYLLRLEFTYTMSVFVSEIPLANMVFTFAKSLMEGNHGSDLRFKDEDVWSILNFLGVKCDSEQASNVVNLYKSQKQSPLLLCMLKCMPMYKEPIGLDNESPNESLSSSVKSLDSLRTKPRLHHTSSVNNKCKHSAFCKVCQSQVLRIKEKYKKKKKNYTQNMKESSMKHVDSMLKNIDSVERCLIDEMFQQLKSTYDTEIEMLKENEEKRVKNCLVVHAVQLQKKRVELEEKFKAREDELERSVQQKKRFLWGLAKLLRDQHAQMSQAMQDIRAETTRLTAKEESLKSQLAEAEEILRARGEDMRHQISNELIILEGHLESMKRERDIIHKERAELDQIKNLRDGGNTKEEDDHRPHYDLLKEEFQILRKYLETTKLEPKCVVERSTITEMADVTSKIDVVLNNEQDLEKSSTDFTLRAKQVVNNLKKLKNVNFSQPNLTEVYSERSRSTHSRSTASSEAGDAFDKEESSVQRLREENERLRTFAQQQREHIDELSSQQARLQAELVAARLPHGAAACRPRTAPAIANAASYMQRLNTSVNNNLDHGWRKGAGEELNYFTNVHPQIVVPGDTLPFIGVVRERHTDNRRYLINQWRSLRRMSPINADIEPRNKDGAGSAGPSIRLQSEEDLNNNENLKHTEPPLQTTREEQPKTEQVPIKHREKSPKSVLREAKEKLKPKDKKAKKPPVGREQSPNTVLREAKLRLRKLEIEAEAVEKSYLDFRRKREAMKNEKRNTTFNDHNNAASEKWSTENINNNPVSSERRNELKKDYNHNAKEKALKHIQPSTPKADKTRPNELTTHENPPKTPEYSEYIEEFHAKYDISKTHFKNRNTTSAKQIPIPSTFSTYIEASHKENTNQNYLETPIIEFRKYYQSEKRLKNKVIVENRPKTSEINKVNNFDGERSISPIIINTALIHDAILLKTPPRSRANSASGSLPKSPLSLNASTIEGKINTSPPTQDFPENNSDCFKFPIPRTPEKLDVQNRSPRLIEASNGGNDNEESRTETLRNIKQDKVKELEIRKDVTKMYNLSKNNIAENENLNQADENAKLNSEKKSVRDGTITEIPRDETVNNFDSKECIEEKNLLRIELQNVTQVHDVKITESQTHDLLLVVESAEHSKLDFQKDKLNTNTTIIVTPQTSRAEGLSEDVIKSAMNGNSSEKSARQHVFNSVADPDINISNNQALMRATSDLDANEDPDYPDEFSADLDNLNNQYDTDSDRSPISMPKTSEHDDFWDS